MKDKLAIIGSGEQAVIIADQARKMDIETHSFSDAASDRVMGHSDKHHLVSIFDVNEIIEICKKAGINGVISTTELTISITAKVAHELGLFGMPVELSEVITNKDYVRGCAEGINIIKQPEYLVCDVHNEIPVMEKFPVIVKPTSLGGKRGITVVNSQNDMSAAIKHAIMDMPQNKTKIIIENYIRGGKEYSVESLSFQGEHNVIQITEKITSGPPHCVELGHMQPAELSLEMRDKVKAAILELLSAVGIDNTTSHTELKIVDEDIYLIELNARSGGDHISYPLTELSTGYSYIQGSIEIALGKYKVPDLKSYPRKNCGVLFVTKQTEYLEELFNHCEKYPWLYKKNRVTSELEEIIHNKSFDTNYFIYVADEGIPNEIEEIMKLKNKI